MIELKKTLPVSLILTIVLLSTLVTAETGYITDDVDDVYFNSDGDVELHINDKPMIDIIKTMYSTTESSVTITIEINPKGAIEDSDRALYYAEYESKDAIYQFRYANEGGTAMVESGGTKGPVTAEYDIAGPTISATFELVGEDTSQVKLYGYAHYYDDASAGIMGDYWMDNTGGTSDQGNGGNNNNNGGGGSPGFELLALIAALGIAFIILRKKW
jgi:hypothetical protein